jgi:hypothetical protein
MFATEIDWLGQHFTEILDNNASAFSVCAGIYADADVHRKLPVGPAADSPAMF